MKRFEKYFPMLIVSVTIFTMVVSSITALAEYASQPPAHSASYAVLHSSPYDTSISTADQSRAVKASRRGLDSDQLHGDNQWIY